MRCVCSGSTTGLRCHDSFSFHETLSLLLPVQRRQRHKSSTKHRTYINQYIYCRREVWPVVSGWCCNARSNHVTARTQRQLTALHKRADVPHHVTFGHCAWSRLVVHRAPAVVSLCNAAQTTQLISRGDVVLVLLCLLMWQEVNVRSTNTLTKQAAHQCAIKNPEKTTSVSALDGALGCLHDWKPGRRQDSIVRSFLFLQHTYYYNTTLLTFAYSSQPGSITCAACDERRNRSRHRNRQLDDN